MIATILSLGAKFWFANWKWLSIAASVFVLLVVVNAWDNKRLENAFNAGVVDCNKKHKAASDKAIIQANLQFNNEVKIRQDADNEATRLSRLARDAVSRDNNDRFDRLRNAFAAPRYSNNTKVVGITTTTKGDSTTNESTDRTGNTGARAGSDAAIAIIEKQRDASIKLAFEMRSVAATCAADVGIAYDQLKKVEDGSNSN
jgi:hypothetical protein